MSTEPQKFNSLAVESLSLLLGLLTCFYLNALYGLSVILISCVTTLLIDFSLNDQKRITSPFYCGSFAGMISSSLLKDDLHLLALGICSVVVYQISKKFFIGFGGKLGSIAFVSSMLSYFIGGLWN